MFRQPKTCIQCGCTFQARKGQKLCTVNCVNQRAKVTQRLRKRGSATTDIGKIKQRAQSAVASAVAAKVLERRACEYFVDWQGRVCGALKTHAHHEDYSRPLDVVWLCPCHHARRHRELRDNPSTPLLIERPGFPQPDRDW